MAEGGRAHLTKSSDWKTWGPGGKIRHPWQKGFSPLFNTEHRVSLTENSRNRETPEGPLVPQNLLPGPPMADKASVATDEGIVPEHRGEVASGGCVEGQGILQILHTDVVDVGMCFLWEVFGLGQFLVCLFH